MLSCTSDIYMYVSVKHVTYLTLLLLDRSQSSGILCDIIPRLVILFVYSFMRVPYICIIYLRFVIEWFNEVIHVLIHMLYYNLCVGRGYDWVTFVFHLIYFNFSTKALDVAFFVLEACFYYEICSYNIWAVTLLKPKMCCCHGCF